MENEKVEKTSENVVNLAEAEEKFKKYSQVEDIFHNGLIGVFEDGKYTIDDDIKEELKKLNKVLDSKDSKMLACHAKYHDFLFNFVVEFERQSIYSSAKLYLIEEKEEETEVKKFKTLVSSEVVSEGVDIEKQAMKVWHISTEDTPNELKLSELDSIIIRLSKDRIFGRDLVEILSQLYIFQMQKLLEAVGDAGKAVVKEYNELLRLVLIKRPAIMTNFTIQKGLLEKVLADSGILEILKKEHSEELAGIYKEFYEPLEKISIKKEKSAEAEKTPRIMDSTEIGAPAKKPKATVKAGKGEKITYFQPAKPGKVSPFGNYKENGGGGVVKIKPTEAKLPPAPKFEAKQEAKADTPVKNVEKKATPDVSRNLKDEFGNQFAEITDELKIEFGATFNKSHTTQNENIKNDKQLDF